MTMLHRLQQQQHDNKPDQKNHQHVNQMWVGHLNARGVGVADLTHEKTIACQMSNFVNTQKQATTTTMKLQCVC